MAAMRKGVVVLSNDIPLSCVQAEGAAGVWHQAVHVFRRRFVVHFIRRVVYEQDHRAGDGPELRFAETDRAWGGKGADQRRMTAQNSARPWTASARDSTDCLESAGKEFVSATAVMPPRSAASMYCP